MNAVYNEAQSLSSVSDALIEITHLTIAPLKAARKRENEKVKRKEKRGSQSLDEMI